MTDYNDALCITRLRQERNEAETAAGVEASENRRLRKRIEELEDECIQLKQGYTAIRNDMARYQKLIEEPENE